MAPSTPYPLAPTVVLPSIQEMFPDHFLSRTPLCLAQGHFNPALEMAHRSGYEPHALDGLKGCPHSLPLHHMAPIPHCARRTSSRASSSSGSSNDEEMDCGWGAEVGGGDRGHPCPTCGKRFKRPSSLRIHLNTHTGATPFRCPYPGCGRTFNVNSNMRRHYRNHAAVGDEAQGPLMARPWTLTDSSPSSPVLAENARRKGPRKSDSSYHVPSTPVSPRAPR